MGFAQYVLSAAIFVSEWENFPWPIRTRESTPSRVPVGAEVLIVTVRSSVAVTLVIGASTVFNAAPHPIYRSIEPLTSAAVNGWPSLNLTPG